MMRVAFKHKSGVEIFKLQERLRAELPKQVGPWFREELLKLQVPEAEADAKVTEEREYQPDAADQAAPAV